MRGSTVLQRGYLELLGRLMSAKVGDRGVGRTKDSHGAGRTEGWEMRVLRSNIFFISLDFAWVRWVTACWMSQKVGAFL